jgi:hypothetical protein
MTDCISRAQLGHNCEHDEDMKQNQPVAALLKFDSRELMHAVSSAVRDYRRKNALWKIRQPNTSCSQSHRSLRQRSHISPDIDTGHAVFALNVDMQNATSPHFGALLTNEASSCGAGCKTISHHQRN